MLGKKRSLFLGSLICLALLGCRHTVVQGEREESFRPFDQDRVEDVLLSEYLSRRTALLLSGAIPRKVERTGNGWNIDLAPVDGPPPELGLGSAIPLTSDGYFLTAAHNLVRPPYTVAILKEGGVSFSEATILWSGSPLDPEEDFAVLKTSLRPEGIFVWDDADTLRTGMPLASLSAPHGLCGGTLVESTTLRNPKLPCGVLRVAHDLPLLQGDSGGPVVGRDGRLVGMNILQKGNLTASKSGWAIRPERKWILALVTGRK
jgi:S1-C subfamily serine protease